MAFCEAKLNSSGDNVTYFTFTFEILAETAETAKVLWVTIGVAQPEVMTCDLHGQLCQAILFYLMHQLFCWTYTVLCWAGHYLCVCL